MPSPLLSLTRVLTVYRCGDLFGCFRIAESVRRYFADVSDELPGAVFPGVAQRKGAARRARDVQCFQTRSAQILIQNTDWVVGNDVLGASDRERRDRQSTGQGFELHDAERVGQAREYKDIGGGEMRRQGSVLKLSEKFGLREALFQLLLHGALADHHFGARQVQGEKCIKVLFDGDAAQGDEDRPRKSDVDGPVWPEQF